MKKTLLLFLLLLTPFAHAYNPSNMVVEGAAWYTKDDGSYMTIRFFSLKHDKTTLYCTGWVLQSSYDEWDRNKDIPGHVATRKDFVDWFSKKQSSSNFPNYFDGNNNGLPDWRELIAGGEYLYWKDLGNGWQFYVNGQMLACNSDTNWQNTLFQDLPPSSAQQYPDENHNGIPDVVDAAIAAGGGASSEGGNITVTVNNQPITVNVDNQPVLDALQTLSTQIGSSSPGSGQTGGLSSSDLQSLLDAINNVNSGLLTTEQFLEQTSGIYRDFRMDYDERFSRWEWLTEINKDNVYQIRTVNLPAILNELTGIRDTVIDIRTTVGDKMSETNQLLDNILALNDTMSSRLHDIAESNNSENLAESLATALANTKITVVVEGWGDLINSVDTVASGVADCATNTGDILQHLRQVQQPTLQTIATNTKNTHDAILELIQEVKKINSAGPAFGQDPERENADDLLDETRSGIDSKQQDYEDEDKQTEDDAEELKDYHKDKQNHGERLRKKICQLFDIDIERSHPMKPSNQETGHHEITWYNTRPIANLTGDSSVKGRMLTQSFELDPRRFLNASETWNGEDSSIMKDAYRDIVIPGMDIARTFLLFIVAWNFFGAIFDLVKETWSA